MSQEVVFSYKARGNSSPKDKPRVYFTCHPEDFECCFEKICEDIFKTHDCTVYYTDDMNADLSDENNQVDLERMNLFVIPVTFRLLTQPNRAMDSDFRFAMEKHIPILPMMMEAGIDEFYRKPDKFGELQYINPYSHDPTEISYEEKLKKHLESVLVSDELAERVRNAFDAYIFLSYRKKDRAYANDLMRLIHKNPECRDIAIWFDEFLNPGVSFKDNITKMLNKSELFALLVTPNLLEMPEGKPNFVMAEEYPAARDSCMEVLPAEMKQTDRSALSSLFKELPECVDARDDKEFRERLLKSLRKVAVSENNDDPGQNYLIGLAYLEGIDVEVDNKRAVELIESAGEAGNPEAIERLCQMYENGEKVEVDLNKALYWAKKLYECSNCKYGGQHPETLRACNTLAKIYHELGNYGKAIDIDIETYSILCKNNGAESISALTLLNNIAAAYGQAGNYDLAIEYSKKVCSVCREKAGKYVELYIVSLDILSLSLCGQGRYKEAKYYSEQVLDICRAFYGIQNPFTLHAMNNLSYIYLAVGKYQDALSLLNDAYSLQCHILGESHPDTLITLGNIAQAYDGIGKHKEALDINDKVFNMRCSILGEGHPFTLRALSGVARSYGMLGYHEDELKLFKAIYEEYCNLYGTEHPETLKKLSGIAYSYGELKDYANALEIGQRAYQLQSRILGDKHPDTLMTLHDLAYVYGELGETDISFSITKKVCELRSEVLGENHPDYLLSLSNFAFFYRNGEDHKTAAELFEKVYNGLRSSIGEDNIQTLSSLIVLADEYVQIHKITEAIDLYLKLYEYQLKVFGPNHTETKLTDEKISRLRSMIGEINSDE